MEEKTIIALEIGSSKIKGAVGTVDQTGALSVKAVEEEKISDIVRYGCIRNVVETANAVRSVVSRLEQREAPRKIERVYLSLGGRSLTSECVDIERRFASETEITYEIIKDITDEALNRPLSDRTVVRALPRELRVDNAPTQRPVGMYGQQISARLNLVSCRNQLLKNLTQVVEGRLGLQVEDVYVRPLVEADLVLMSDEKRLGCMLVDFGAETTTVAIYKHGVLVHLAVLPMGSRNITRDLTAMNCLEERAEELKIQFGTAGGPDAQQMVRPLENLDLALINSYVGARATEILLNVVEQIKYAGLTPDQLPGGVVVVGRGARLSGLTSRLEQMLSGIKVRMGIPDNRVRILDGRIQSSDAVDVIALLAAAARAGAHECLSAQPRPVQPAQPVQAAQPAPAQATANVYQHPYQGNVDRPDTYVQPQRTSTWQGGATAPTPTPTPATGPAPRPRPVPQPAPQPAPAPQPKPAPAPAPAPEPEPEKPRRKNVLGAFMDRLKVQVANILTDNLYEDGDEE